MSTTTFSPAVGTLVKVQGPTDTNIHPVPRYAYVWANFEAFSSDMEDVLVSVSGHPKRHVGSDDLYWVPVQAVTFMC